MPGDKKIANSQSGLKADARLNMTDQNLILGKVGIPSDISVNSGIGNKGVTEQSVHYPPAMSYDHHYPAGHSGTYHQSDASCHQNCGGTSYIDNSSLLYYMPGYSQYGQQSFDGQDPHFSSSECMPCYSWNSAYTNDARSQNPISWASKSTMGSYGSIKSNGFNSKRSMTSFNDRFPNHPLDVHSRQSTSNISQSILQSSHLCSLNKSSAACHSGGLAKGYQPCSTLSSFSHQNQGGLFATYSMIHAPKVKESQELTCGPRAHNSVINHEESVHNLKNNQYNLDGFQTNYEQAKFYVIKSYSEDDVHKCVKYDVWSSTPNGNKKLNIAFHEAEGNKREKGSRCPVFLFFSVNGSGQFVGVAEMMGPVVFEKDMDFWQLDKWSGFFPVKWHIIKDIPNSQLRRIILENNDNRPVTYTRDTQEVGLQQGLEMLDIFKGYPSKTSLLDDLSFYENREKLLKARRIGKVAFQPEKTSKSGEGSMSTNGLLDPASSLIKLTRNLSFNRNMPKDKPST